MEDRKRDPIKSGRALKIGGVHLGTSTWDPSTGSGQVLDVLNQKEEVRQTLTALNATIHVN